MKAYELKEMTGPTGLILNAERPEPEAGHGEVKIKVHAASLNYRDLLVASGLLTLPTMFPISTTIPQQN